MQHIYEVNHGGFFLYITKKNPAEVNANMSIMNLGYTFPDPWTFKSFEDVDGVATNFSDSLSRLAWSQMTQSYVLSEESNFVYDVKRLKLWKLETFLIKAYMQDSWSAGINGSYLYHARPFTYFPWHIEDNSLFSVSVLHYGAPKTSYVTPLPYARQIEALDSAWFPRNL